MRILIILPAILLLMGCSHFREQRTIDKLPLEPDWLCGTSGINDVYQRYPCQTEKREDWK